MADLLLNELGLRPKDMDFLHTAFSENADLELVKIFGSRATEKFHRGSDIDLVLYGQKLSPDALSRIRHQLQYESPTLLHFDILWFPEISNALLLQQIEQEGRIIFTKKES